MGKTAMIDKGLLSRAKSEVASAGIGDNNSIRRLKQQRKQGERTFPILSIYEKI